MCISCKHACCSCCQPSTPGACVILLVLSCECWLLSYRHGTQLHSPWLLQPLQQTKLQGNKVFFTFPTTTKIRKVWLSLIIRCSSEVSFHHSRICSEHFIDGKKMKDNIPELFPWQGHAVTPTKDAPATVDSTAAVPTSCELALSPLDIVHHDHCYFIPPTQPSTHLAPILDTLVILPLSTIDTVDIGTQISLPPFSVECIADGDSAIHFYTGFNNYNKFKICYSFLGSAVHHLKYWEDHTKYLQWKTVEFCERTGLESPS